MARQPNNKQQRKQKLGENASNKWRSPIDSYHLPRIKAASKGG